VRVVLLGPPGVGKGTQGRRLAADKGWALISTGEILRDAAARGTELGRKAQLLMDAGKLVGDDVMIGLVEERTSKPDAQRGYILDGFPRTVPQAEALEEMLDGRGQALDRVVNLTAPENELVSRLTARRECPRCKRAYNVRSAPSRDGIHCDDHPDVELVQRKDDDEATIRKRLEVYKQQTEPLVAHYRAKGTLLDVKGTGREAEVFDALQRAVGCAEGRG